MSRSPLAYPLNRSADMDVGGAADLQTDIMRFMAILSLCLVAIFALVQSIPLTPTEPDPVQAVSASTSPPTNPEQQIEPKPQSAVEPAPVEQAVVLTRPKWVPKYSPKTSVGREALPEPAPEPIIESVAPQRAEPAPTPAPAESEREGFTLRFASDTALMGAVAAHHVGLSAIEPGRAKRMTVSESRISFWDASTPNLFHEMETTTVPAGVIEALARTGMATGTVNWGVTLPGKMKSQLDALMQKHRGGSLIIGAGGDIHWEAS